MTFGPRTRQKIDHVRAVAERHGSHSIIILSGTAGTGKTTFALTAAQLLCRHPLFVTQVQFHPGYGYDDFMEGLQPNEVGGFVARDGVFGYVNDRALRDPANKYVLLVEELTRANVSGVLGELMTYLEHRQRTFLTPVTRRETRVAENLVFMATMNPRDRSALEIDEALIRRLRVIDCPPDTEQLREMLDGRDLSGEVVGGLVEMFETIREEHGTRKFNQLMPFGHGVFAHVHRDSDLADLWRQQLVHLLHRPHAPDHPFAKEIHHLYPNDVAREEDT